MEFINAGWFGVLMGIAVSVWGGFYFGRRYAKEPIACYAMESMKVIGTHRDTAIAEHIRVSYKGADVSELWVTTATFYNAGTALLDKASFIETDPLRFEFTGSGQLLDAHVSENPFPHCACVVARDADGRAATVSFDHLAAGQGFALRLLHTGPGTAVQFAGSLKGIRSDPERTLLPQSRVVAALSSWLTRAFWSLLFCAVVLGMLSFLASRAFMPVWVQGVASLFGVGAAFVTILGVPVMFINIAVEIGESVRRSRLNHRRPALLTK